MNTRNLQRHLVSFLLTAAIAAPALLTGCSARVSTGYTVHDGYYSDNHVWDNNEVVYYNRWETDTHRQHEDYKKRSAAEQNEYWQYRHNNDHR